MKLLVGSNEVSNTNSCLDAHVKKLGIDLLILSTLAMSHHAWIASYLPEILVAAVS
jgi:hypothetical protein